MTGRKDMARTTEVLCGLVVISGLSRREIECHRSSASVRI
jgi:hypothetical protein